MSYPPSSLLTLRAFLRPLTGLPDVSLGIVGDANHDDGYHLGRDRIYGAGGRGDADYSVRTARDRAGLTNAASALDVGAFDRGGRSLLGLSRFLVSQARANAPDTRDIREIIWGDGGVVWRWDRERGVDSAPRTGEASASHLTHTHISWYRDAESRDHGGAFRRYFAAEEETVQSFPVYDRRAYVTLRAGAKLYDNSALTPTDRTVTVPTQREYVYVGTFSDSLRLVAWDDPAFGSGLAMFVRASDLVGAPRFVNDLTDDVRRSIRSAAFSEARSAIANLKP